MPKTDDPCKNCGHPYVRHTVILKGRETWDRKFLPCRDCPCPEFRPEVSDGED